MKNKLLKLLAYSTATLLVGSTFETNSMFTGRQGMRIAKAIADSQPSADTQPNHLAEPLQQADTKTQQQLLESTAKAVKKCRDAIAFIAHGQNTSKQAINQAEALTELSRALQSLNTAKKTFIEKFGAGAALEYQNAPHLSALLTICGNAAGNFNLANMDTTSWKGTDKLSGYRMDPSLSPSYTSLATTIEAAIGEIRDRAMSATNVADTYKSYGMQDYPTLSLSLLTEGEDFIQQALEENPNLKPIKAILDNL